MRLAQIARKVGLTPIEIKRFLESEFEVSIGNEPNYKLDDDQINSVLEQFPIPVKEVETPKVTEGAEKSIEDDQPAVTEIAAETEVITEEAIEAVSEEIDAPEIVQEAIVAEESTAVEETSSVEETIESIEQDIADIEAIEKSESALEISYEEPLEAVDSDAPFVEVAVDREAELIKAPTVKLDGLKVLGKIELPEKKVAVVEKTDEEIEQEEADAIADLDAAMQSQAQDIKPAKTTRVEAKETKDHLPSEEESYSEYKDNRGIYHFSLQQKQNREKALIRIELERKREFDKEKKKRHYEEVMKGRKQKESVTVSKKKQQKIETRKQKREEKNVEPPKGLWAKFMHWLND